MSGFKQSVRMVALGDMNARVGNVEMEGVIGMFEGPGVNWAGERMVEFCAESSLIVGNMWFKKKIVNKYERVRDRGTDEALMDWVLVDKRLKGRQEDVNVLSSCLSIVDNDHFLVVA
jgi:hypothetical protein